MASGFSSVKVGIGLPMAGLLIVNLFTVAAMFWGSGGNDASTLHTVGVLMLIAAFLLFFFGMWLLQGKFMAPLMESIATMEKIAAGDLTARAYTRASGELGLLVKAVNDMGDKLTQMMKDIKRDADEMAQATDTVRMAGQEFSDQSGNMEMTVDAVVQSAEVVNENIQLVSSATQDLDTAANEIAQSVAETARITNEAQGKAQETNEVINRLGESSDKIGNIIQVINTIAEQTNLLALNATIEAARAGEAGKGFAVVANEVKELARQTADATQEITTMIQTIQADTKEAVSSVEEITAIVAQVNDLANTIASAAEEQTATVSEISSNVSDAASKVEDVRDKADGTKISVQETVSLAQKYLDASGVLAELSGRLQELIKAFKIQ